jgi:hypothetical protein
MRYYGSSHSICQYYLFVTIFLFLFSASSHVFAAACTNNTSPITDCEDLVITNPSVAVTIGSGITVSDTAGNFAFDNQPGALGTVLVNDGTIDASIGNGVGVFNETGASFSTIINNGTINGYYSLFNDDTITTIINGSQGQMLGSAYGIANIGAIDTITNLGTINAASDDIINVGTIGTLNNAQGGHSSAGVLTYNGTLPSTYNIIITNTQTYGQLAVSGASGTMNFGIFSASALNPAGGAYTQVLTGVQASNLMNTSGVYGGDPWHLLLESGSIDDWDLIFSPYGPTFSDEQSATQALSNTQRAMMISSRSTANELLGMTRAVDQKTYTYAGGMFGSALGYAGGQASRGGVTILGGVAYGSQDYNNIRADAAPTIALATRYTFANPIVLVDQELRPFVEIGGWIAPSTQLTFTRPYNNEGFTDSGIGSTNATSWDEYFRGGLTVNLSATDKITGFGEIDEQSMGFDGYTEATSVTNPFPATINSGVIRMTILRAGPSWTHDVGSIHWDDNHATPLAVTFAGAVAHSFNVHSGLTAVVPDIGTTMASNTSDTWGEFGARIEGELTKSITLDFDIAGTAGGTDIGTSVHGGVGLGYTF